MSSNPIRKKLIEVALPLEAINDAAVREKSIRHGHPSTLHLWWARRPLAAARAVLFAQLVDDPSAWPDLFKDEKAQQKERKRLFGIIERLVQWENTTNEEVLNEAREEIWQSWRRTCAANATHPQAAELFDRNKLPAFHDPFAGGGAIPLEAQRLGLESWASDLNPVAVLINKAMIEIPPRFAGNEPVNPAWRTKITTEQMGANWKGARGLADDVRFYGERMREKAFQKIGHLYPTVTITPEMAVERPDLSALIGEKLTVIAWIWARTVKSPNPAFSEVEVPLASTFMLSTKPGKEAWIEPVIDGKSYSFKVRIGKPDEVAKTGTSAGKRAAFKCILSGTPISYDFIRNAGQNGRMGTVQLAIVCDSKNGRMYLNPNNDNVETQITPNSFFYPDVKLEGKSRINVSLYGIDVFGDLFTPRQLVALTTFSDLIPEMIEEIRQDAIAAGLAADNKKLDDGGTSALAYAEAVGVYLGFAVDKLADYCSSICTWNSAGEKMRNVFGRQAIPMVWDYAECNPFSTSSGNFYAMINWIWKVIDQFNFCGTGFSYQQNAEIQTISKSKIVSTDPPYYDNIGYADLSDFFYVWMRRNIKHIYPNLFSTVSVPKAEELVATPYRHGSKEKAEVFFLEGMTSAMKSLSTQCIVGFPVSIYYAFKQAESEKEGKTASTGWETFLEAVIRAGFAINGTWPMRTEMGVRMIGSGTNALASSIVLVCRAKADGLPVVSRREFVADLKSELPSAVRLLQSGNVAPVDLAQSAIGPGMAVFTRYEQVIDATGQPMKVRDALALINQILDEVLAEQEGDFDADTRWALAWFEQNGFTEGEYGTAETLSKAKNTSLAGLVSAGILVSGRGKVRLFKPAELTPDWNPETDNRLTVWEMVHHLIRVYEKGGEEDAADLIQKLGSKADVARELSYRLFTICERKKWAPEALSYNALVQGWSGIQMEATRVKQPIAKQGDMFEE